VARIYVDAWCVKGGPHGVGRYCRSLLPPLVAAAPQHEFIILRPPRTDSDDRLVDAALGTEVEIRLPRADWATLVFRPALERVFKRHGLPALYHSLFHMLPLALKRGQGPRAVAVTLHDLICLDYAGEVKSNVFATQWVKRFDRAVIPYALRHADHVICDSEATRQRAAEWVPLERSTTVHCGVDSRFFSGDGQRPASLPFGIDSSRPFVAVFGNPRPFKNVRCVVRAVSILRETHPDFRLVLIGNDGGTADLVRHCALEAHTIVTRPPTDLELRTIIAAARLFVVPSKAEGFGLPLLEAMAAGTPVAASDIPVLHEVGGDAALWFDPDDPGQLAAIAARVDADAELRSDLAARGRARAAAFDWMRTATATLDVYNRLLMRSTT
jgi:glycosyltransferase involved in cell wall biosynthesis